MMLRATFLLAIAAAASANFNLTAGPPTPKDARLLDWQNTTAAKLAIAGQALNKTITPKAAVAAEIATIKSGIMVKLNKMNATCSPGTYTISTRRRSLLAGECAVGGAVCVCVLRGGMRVGWSNANLSARALTSPPQPPLNRQRLCQMWYWELLPRRSAAASPC